MNTLLFIIIGIPIVEIYLFIKVGSQIGTFNTLKAGMSQIVKNEIPVYEIISGAAIAFASILLIIPGFATDFLGLLIIFPPTRKLILKKVSTKHNSSDTKKDFINGEYEDIEDENDRKL